MIDELLYFFFLKIAEFTLKNFTFVTGLEASNLFHSIALLNMDFNSVKALLVAAGLTSFTLSTLNFSIRWGVISVKYLSAKNLLRAFIEPT